MAPPDAAYPDPPCSTVTRACMNRRNNLRRCIVPCEVSFPEWQRIKDVEKLRNRPPFHFDSSCVRKVARSRCHMGHSVASTGGRAFASRALRLKYHRPADRKIGTFPPRLQGFAGLPRARLGSHRRGEGVSPGGIAFDCAWCEFRLGFHTRPERSPCAGRSPACRGLPAQLSFSRCPMRLARPKRSAMPATVTSIDTPTVSG